MELTSNRSPLPPGFLPRQRKAHQRQVKGDCVTPTSAEWYGGVVKVISGGQTGADQAGLLAAREKGLLTGGWATHGYSTSRGRQPELLSGLGLQPVPVRGKGGYVVRSQRNVDDSDATVVFREYSSPGSDKTIGYCCTGRWQVKGPGTPHRPVLVISTLSATNPGSLGWRKLVSQVVSFLERHRVRVLNVAGHGESGRLPNWQATVYRFMVAVLRRLDALRSLVGHTRDPPAHDDHDEQPTHSKKPRIQAETLPTCKDIDQCPPTTTVCHAEAGAM